MNTQCKLLAVLFLTCGILSPVGRADSDEVAESVTNRYGPWDNRADLMRHFGGIGPIDKGFAIHERLQDIGFNAYSCAFGGSWNYAANAPSAKNNLASRQPFFDRLRKDGVSVIDSISASRKEFIRLYPRRFMNGKENLQNLDASNPEAVRTGAYAADWLARNAGHSVVIGVEPANEVRGRAHFSFTTNALAAYRAYAGHDIPAVVLAALEKNPRTPPHWSKIANFPADRVVADDDPILDFYRWVWKAGDGWNDYCTQVIEAYRRGIGHDVFGMYSPALRTPAFWGVGGNVDCVRNWEYPYAEPYRLATTAAMLQSVARGRGKMVITSVQGISYRSRIAPMKIHPANEPAWTKKYPNTKYPTTPPDVMREALWAVLSLRVDGIATHGVDALLDMNTLTEVPKDYNLGEGYRCANPETANALRDVFQSLAIPLGPLLRAVPEREPQVAVLASYSSQILGSRISWNCQGRFFDAGVLGTAANLMPYMINEEEVSERGVPPTVKALLVADCDVLTRSAYENIRKFVARGGMIVADETLLPALRRDAELPNVAAAYTATKSDHDDGRSESTMDADVRTRLIREAVRKLRAAVLSRVTLHADTDKPDLFVRVRTWKDADYVFPLNDKRTFGDYVGPWRCLMEKGLPNAGTVTVRRPAGAVYDLVLHRAVPFESKDGETRIPVSFETCDGKALLVVPAPLGGLTYSVRGTKVTVRSPDRNVMIPIRIDGMTGRPFYGVMKDGAWAHDFKETPCGTVAVTNLADGRAARKE